MNAPKRTRRPAGSRNHPVQIDLEGAFENGKSDINSLREEMGEWKDNLEGNNMEHLPKYEDVSECFDALETADDELQSLELPGFLSDVICRYTQDTRQSAQSRAGRLGNAVNALEAVKSDVESWLENNPELEQVETVEEGGPDDLMENQTTDEDAVGARENERSEAEEFLSSLEERLSELENVSFPGMY